MKAARQGRSKGHGARRMGAAVMRGRAEKNAVAGGGAEDEGHVPTAKPRL